MEDVASSGVRIKSQAKVKIQIDVAQHGIDPTIVRYLSPRAQTVLWVQHELSPSPHLGPRSHLISTISAPHLVLTIFVVLASRLSRSSHLGQSHLGSSIISSWPVSPWPSLSSHLVSVARSSRLGQSRFDHLYRLISVSLVSTISIISSQLASSR